MTFATAGRKPVTLPPIRDTPVKRRLECDETVFKVYKGVRTFDFCKEKNIIATGGEMNFHSIPEKSYFINHYEAFLQGVSKKLFDV